MRPSTPPARVLAAGLALTLVSLVSSPILGLGWDGVLVGLAVRLGATGVITARDSRTGVAVGVLALLVVAPVAVVAILLALHADPLAVFLLGTGLAIYAVLLLVVFLVGYFVTRYRTRRQRPARAVQPMGSSSVISHPSPPGST